MTRRSKRWSWRNSAILLAVASLCALRLYHEYCPTTISVSPTDQEGNNRKDNIAVGPAPGPVPVPTAPRVPTALPNHTNTRTVHVPTALPNHTSTRTVRVPTALSNHTSTRTVRVPTALSNHTSTHTVHVPTALPNHTSTRTVRVPTVLPNHTRLYYTHSDQEETRRMIENSLEEALKLDKGMGCEIPKLDPFAKEFAKFDRKPQMIQCPEQDWVRCLHSKCRVTDDIRNKYQDIICTYKDVLYKTDVMYSVGAPKVLEGDDTYELKESDHVKVACAGRRKNDTLKSDYWSGVTLGFRPVTPLPSPPGREDTFNVVIFGFDSTARTGFIRRMPKSWKMLKELGYTVMDGYNIVGDGTTHALFPLLLGKTQLELPDVRIGKGNASMDDFPFIFYKLKQDGYRTAYFEDMPFVGTFQWRFTGFRRQPADHYLRALYLEAINWTDYMYYCLGDTPQYKLMINITEQFLKLPGKHFLFTFIGDISHDDFNMLEIADNDTSALLRSFMSRAEDTLLIVMGDHGPRHSKLRDTLRGKLDERLPLLAIRLPDRLTRARPHALRALHANAHTLTTPHDLHATILDVLDMRQHWNTYKVPGADLTRALTMLEPIPRNRSCSEAGIETHWCSCLAWQNVSTEDPIYRKTAQALLDYINSLVATIGDCVPRTLTSTSWVLRHQPSRKLLTFNHTLPSNDFVAHFGGKTQVARVTYQVKITVGPGRGVYEATMSYRVKTDKFTIRTSDISRTSPYRNEPDCITKTHPHLNPYCYCRRPP